MDERAKRFLLERAEACGVTMEVRTMSEQHFRVNVDGEDEHGAFQWVPLSMVRGGKKRPYKVYLKPLRHLITDTAPAPRGWYKDKTPASDRIRPRPCYTEAVLTTPYGGFCPINCGHCYINNGVRGYRATGLPVVHLAYPDKLKKQVAKMMVSGAAYITSFSEPFHPLEHTYHITADVAQVFIDEGLPLFYLSRMIPPQWAKDTLLENPYSYIQWSVNTANNDHYRRFSPGSFDLDDLYATIADYSDAGIFVSIQCNPIMAGISTLGDIVGLVYAMASAGAHHIIFKFVEQVANNRQVIVDRMHQRGLPGVEYFDNLFNQVIGGVYTIQEDVRTEWLDVLLEETRKVNITMGLCYEYYDDGKAGGNLAPWYTTADQCHGRGVPLYFRPEPGERFRPLPGCYRKGCLYCLEHGTKVCANERLLQAPELAYNDLRTIRLTGNSLNWNVPDSCWAPTMAQAAPHRRFSNPEMLTDAELWEWDE